MASDYDSISSAEAGGHGIGAELAADSARELFQIVYDARE
jgi:hypothetical protein